MSVIFRTWILFRGFAGRTLGYFERRNPEALLDVEKENLRKLIGQFNQGLVTHAAVSERLISEVGRGEARAAELTSRTSALVRAGEREAASRYALELKEVTAKLADDRRQLNASEETYHELVRTREAAVANARAKIEQVRRQIGELKVRRAIADLEGIAQTMIDGMSSHGDSLNRLEEMVTEEREKAAARGRVNSRHIDPEEARLRERERSALAASALDEFLGQGPMPMPPLPDYSRDRDFAVMRPAPDVD